MLTIFTMPKPFHGHFGVIQRNALTALTKLSPRPEIIVFGNEEGTADVARELGIRHMPEVQRNEFGTPVINDFFSKARQLSPHPLLCYINADILLTDDFTSAVRTVASRKRRFMVAGQRWDLDVTEPLNFEGDWQDQLRQRVRAHGSLHNITGMDYFAFTKDLVDDIPPMAVGRAMWDNWFLYHARAKRAALVDVTSVVMVVHQNHDYSHHPQGKLGISKGPEAQRNKELAGGLDHYFSLRDATHALTTEGLKPFTDSWHVRRRIVALPILRPSLRLPAAAIRKLAAATHGLRTRMGMTLSDVRDASDGARHG